MISIELERGPYHGLDWVLSLHHLLELLHIVLRLDEVVVHVARLAQMVGVLRQLELLFAGR